MLMGLRTHGIGLKRRSPARAVNSLTLAYLVALGGLALTVIIGWQFSDRTLRGPVGSGLGWWTRDRALLEPDEMVQEEEHA